MNRTSSAKLGDEGAAASDSASVLVVPVYDGTSDAAAATAGAAAAAAPAALPPAEPPHLYATLPYRGVSMAGAEFGASVGGLFNGTVMGSMPSNYYYPISDLAQGGPSWPKSSNGTAIETDKMDRYFLGKGMNTIRLPFRWERLQHSLSLTSSKVLTGPQVVATFDAAELGAIKSSVSTLKAAGFVVLIDVHNYAYYTSASEIAVSKGGDSIGSANVPDIAFENLWIGLASIYGGDAKVVFDLMNEPATPRTPPASPRATRGTSPRRRR